MATYAYREDCGSGTIIFEHAADDDAAIAHAEATYRDHADPDFDGDSAVVYRLWLPGDEGWDDDGEWAERIGSFEGEDMIGDPFGERESSAPMTVSQLRAEAELSL